MWNDDMLIGLSEQEAQRTLNMMGIHLRVARRDQEQFVYTLEWNPGRINIEVDNGFVTKVTRG